MDINSSGGPIIGVTFVLIAIATWICAHAVKTLLEIKWPDQNNDRNQD